MLHIDLGKRKYVLIIIYRIIALMIDSTLSSYIKEKSLGSKLLPSMFYSAWHIIIGHAITQM